MPPILLGFFNTLLHDCAPHSLKSPALLSLLACDVSGFGKSITALLIDVAYCSVISCQMTNSASNGFLGGQLPTVSSVLYASQFLMNFWNA